MSRFRLTEAGIVWYSEYVTGKYVFEVDPKDCVYVNSKTGPLLRFKTTFGFVEDPIEGTPGRVYLQTLEGCIGSVDWDSGEFTWSPAIHRFGWKWMQLHTVTKEIKDGVIGALNKAGVVLPFIEKVENYRAIQPAEVARTKHEPAASTTPALEMGTLVDG